MSTWSVTQGGVLALQKVMNGGTPLVLVIVTGLVGSGEMVASVTYQFTSAQIILVLADLGASRLLTREIVRGTSEGLSLGWLIVLRLAVAMGLWAAALSVPLSGLGYLTAVREHLFVAVAWSTLGTISMAFYGWHLGRHEFRTLGKALSVGLAVTGLMALGTFVLEGPSVTGLVWAVGWGRFVEVVMFLASARGRLQWDGDGRAVLRFCRRGLFLSGQQLATMVYSRFSVIAVAEILTTTQFSHFALARSLYSGLSIVPVSLAHSYFPSLVAQVGTGDPKRMLKSLRPYLARTIPLHAGLILLGVLGLLVLPDAWLGEVIPHRRFAYAAICGANLLSLLTAMIGFVYLALQRERLLFGLSALNGLLAFLVTFGLTWFFKESGALASIPIVEVATVALFGWGLRETYSTSFAEERP